MQGISRRDFLAGSTLAAATLLSPGGRSLLASGEKPLKLSLAAYSFNRFLPKSWTPEERAKAKMTLEEFVEFCADLKLDGTELTGYYFPKDVTDDYLQGLKSLVAKKGLEVSGTAIGNDFCHPPGPARDKQLQYCKDWIGYAAKLGAPVIRIFAGRVKKGQNEADAVRLCVEGIQECLELAAEKQVALALENHGGITATPEQMLKIVHGVGKSPFFGVNFDSGNFRTADPYADLAKIAPYAINAQIKVAVHPQGEGKQEADLERVVGILREAGYSRYVVLEYEEKNPRKEIPRYVNRLRELVT